MATIRSLKPKVTREEAIEQFSPGGLRGLLGYLGKGPLRSVATVYVPFCLYRVEVVNGPRRQSLLLAVDAVCGWLDPYRFDKLPEESEQIEIETRNRPEAVLDARRAGEVLTEKVRRLVYSSGFFRISDLSICPEYVPLDLYIPYWVGFFGREEHVRLNVIDAVRGRQEGAKAREFFYLWLSQQRR
jgi:hypothetical protein